MIAILNIFTLNFSFHFVILSLIRISSKLCDSISIIYFTSSNDLSITLSITTASSQLILEHWNIGKLSRHIRSIKIRLQKLILTTWLLIGIYYSLIKRLLLCVITIFKLARCQRLFILWVLASVHNDTTIPFTRFLFLVTVLTLLA